MKQKRYFKTIVCLVLGAVLLTGSAFANYENANGYTRLKEGLTKMLMMGNFSADGEISISVDGKELGYEKIAYQCDFNGSTSSHIKSGDNNGFDQESWEQDGFDISKSTYGGDTSYTVSNATNTGTINYRYLFGTEEEKSAIDSYVNFAELLADTLVGDLKNNVALVSNENGISKYQLDLSAQQIPELIQAGLSMLFSSSSYSSDNMVFFDDQENLTGEQMQTLYDDAYEVLDEHDSTGIAHVKSDGTIEYYESIDDHYKAIGYDNINSIEGAVSVLADDPAIDNVSCTASLDSEGRLTDIKADVKFVGKDKDGNEHSMTVALDVTLYDYGTTKVETFDKSLLNFNWQESDEYFWYNFDAEGNIYEYDSYDYETEYVEDEDDAEVNITQNIDEDDVPADAGTEE